MHLGRVRSKLFDDIRFHMIRGNDNGLGSSYAAGHDSMQVCRERWVTDLRHYLERQIMHGQYCWSAGRREGEVRGVKYIQSTGSKLDRDRKTETLPHRVGDAVSDWNSAGSEVRP